MYAIYIGMILLTIGMLSKQIIINFVFGQTSPEIEHSFHFTPNYILKMSKTMPFWCMRKSFFLHANRFFSAECENILPTHGSCVCSWCQTMCWNDRICHFCNTWAEAQLLQQAIESNCVGMFHMKEFLYRSIAA